MELWGSNAAAQGPRIIPGLSIGQTGATQVKEKAMVGKVPAGKAGLTSAATATRGANGGNALNGAQGQKYGSPGPGIIPGLSIAETGGPQVKEKAMVGTVSAGMAGITSTAKATRGANGGNTLNGAQGQ